MPPRKPQGSVQIVRLYLNENDGRAGCFDVPFRLGNRSDTAVRSIRVHFTGRTTTGAKLDLGTQSMEVGLAPYQENNYTGVVCSRRQRPMSHYTCCDTDIVPTLLGWYWFT
jgi:hypothetical protein